MPRLPWLFLLPGTDALLSGISTEISQGINPDIIVTPLDNWFFMSVSTFVLAGLGTLITEKYVEPRLGAYTGEQQSLSNTVEKGDTLWAISRENNVSVQDLQEWNELDSTLIYPLQQLKVHCEESSSC